MSALCVPANCGTRAYLSLRYRSEFEMLMMIPRPVQRLLFPLIVAAGRVLGWHRRFAGAPEPRRPS
ncbi:MAG: hypothetical protein H0U12_13125 [Thermoleophilaceae bacterium]|nr:hypothetical protein [Thermoleophilaceae bacterium]